MEESLFKLFEEAKTLEVSNISLLRDMNSSLAALEKKLDAEKKTKEDLEIRITKKQADMANETQRCSTIAAHTEQFLLEIPKMRATIEQFNSSSEKEIMPALDKIQKDLYAKIDKLESKVYIVSRQIDDLESQITFKENEIGTTIERRNLLDLAQAEKDLQFQKDHLESEQKKFAAK